MMTDTERKKYYESALHTFSCEARAIAELDRNLDREAFLKTVELLSETQGRIILSACGGTATCARRAVQGFNNVDRAAQFLSPCDAPHGDYGMIRRGEILMLLSKSGKTQELEPLIPVARRRGAYIITVTENPDAAIARDADLVLTLHSGIEACPYQCLSTSSAMAMMAVFDAIDICIMLRNGIDLDYFRIVHPGGGVGDMLRTAAEKKR